MLETGVYKKVEKPFIGAGCIQESVPMRQTEPSPELIDENAGRQTGDFVPEDRGSLGLQTQPHKQVKIIAGTMGVERIEHN